MTKIYLMLFALVFASALDSNAQTVHPDTSIAASQPHNESLEKEQKRIADRKAHQARRIRQSLVRQERAKREAAAVSSAAAAVDLSRTNFLLEQILIQLDPNSLTNQLERYYELERQR